jgi:hypothetical protein
MGSLAKEGKRVLPVLEKVPRPVSIMRLALRWAFSTWLSDASFSEK